MPKCDCEEARNWRFSYDRKLYSGVVRHPAAQLEGPFAFRDHRVVKATMAPVSYDADAGVVEVATRSRMPAVKIYGTTLQDQVTNMLGVFLVSFAAMAAIPFWHHPVNNTASSVTPARPMRSSRSENPPRHLILESVVMGCS